MLAKISNRDYTKDVVSDLRKGRIMDRCPSCNARYAGKPTCRRCGADPTGRFDIALGQWTRIADAPDGEPAPS